MCRPLPVAGSGAVPLAETLRRTLVAQACPTTLSRQTHPLPDVFDMPQPFDSFLGPTGMSRSGFGPTPRMRATSLSSNAPTATVPRSRDSH